MTRPAHQRPRLSHEELAQVCSPDDAHVSRVRSFAEEHGLNVVRVSRVRHDIVLEGPARAMNEAFGVTLEEFDHDHGTCRAHSEDIHLPANLQDIVVAVLGLDNVPFTRPVAFRPPGDQVPHTPLELAEYYDFPASTGRGQRIAVLCFGDCGYYESDMREFFENILDVEMPEITSHSVRGRTCNPLPFDRLREMTEFYRNKVKPSKPFTDTELNWGKNTMEATMDVQVAGGAACGAAIDVYFAPDDKYGWYEAIYAALGLKDDQGRGSGEGLPAAMSISWGASEDSWSKDRLDLLNSALLKAELRHVTVCCSSGDYGSLNQRPGPECKQAKVNFPASSRHALGCGGTSFHHIAEQNELVETSWNAQTEFGHEATGGGVSGIIPLPAYQQSADVPPHDRLNGDAWLHDGLPAGFAGRGVPDVAAYADVGFTIYIGGQTYVTGGTSSSTPLWAGLIARLGESLGRRVGWLNEFVYRPDFGKAFRPVVTGNNKLVDTGAAYFEARQGWNGCCGLGVPDGQTLLACLQEALDDD